MLLRKLKNRLFTICKGRILRISYVDNNAEIGKDVYIGNSEIHGNVIIEENCRIHKCLIGGDVKIGRYTSLWGPNIQVLAINNSIEIGNFCSIARDVTIQEYFHDHQKLTTFYIGRNVFGESINDEVVSKGNIKIGHDVWIGTGVQIMSGVTIGNGVVIAANSTVTKDVPPYSIVAGTPAKVIKMRFPDDIIEKIESLKWWDWDLETIKNNKKLFKLKNSELTDLINQLTNQ